MNDSVTIAAAFAALTAPGSGRWPHISPLTPRRSRARARVSKQTITAASPGTSPASPPASPTDTHGAETCRRIP